ncbi:MAG: cadherin-like domain-containing protein, partial [Proteobacteria bacterium]|nr:cadherin-like domain-containing protein [Pseudomonadota bacterium]
MNFLIQQKKFPVVILSLLLSLTASALVEYDQDVTTQVIFGSGNSNGNFTTDRRNGVEVGLRAKIPFVGTTNSNGDGTYSFTLEETDHDNNSGTDRRWNFEFSVNTNYDGSSGNDIDQYTYELGIDGDPGDGSNFLVFDPITPTVTQPFFDHSIGDNSTANGAGTEATDGPSYLSLIANNNLLQQSWRHAFFPFPPLDTYNPDSPGTYDVYLIVRLAGTEVARTDIKVIINDHLVTPDVIFGSGNANGNFTLARNDDVEIGLRAKIPFTGLTNYDGVNTYSYTIAETYHGDATDMNRWNFEFSVNTDYSDTNSAGLNVSDFTYEMGLDADPSLATNFLVANPILPVGGLGALSPDHSFGDNMTANGGGVEPLVPINFFYTPLYGGDNNVVQNSLSYAFLTAVPPLDTYDNSVPGTYDIYLLVRSAGIEVARVDIRVLIEGGAPNEAPVTTADNYATNEDVSLSVNNPNGVLANDTDIDGDILQVVEVGTINANGGIGGDITMAADGTFSYTPPADFNGMATFDFTVSDGALTTASSLTITVNAVNDVPSFIKGADQTVLEDAGAQTINMWATALSAGPANESSQVLSFNLSNDNNALFSVQPAVDSSGNLSYTAATDANGSATIAINIMDDGTTINGGVDTSADQSFTISVTAVNDAPEFDIQGDQIFIGLQNNIVQVIGFANNIVLEPNGGEGQVIDEFTVVETIDTQNILNSATIDSNG